MYLPSSDLTSSRVGMIFRRISPIVSISALTLRMLRRANKSIERQEQKQRHWTLHVDSLQHYNNNKNNDNFFFLIVNRAELWKTKKLEPKKTTTNKKPLNTCLGLPQWTEIRVTDMHLTLAHSTNINPEDVQQAMRESYLFHTPHHWEDIERSKGGRN